MQTGVSLNWGDANAIVEWTKKMGLREGFGAQDYVDLYNAVRGWSKDGIPTEETLKKLGLEEYVGRA